MMPLGWFGIVRLGLVQAALGAVVVLVTSTLNRIMVVELALPAVVPGGLVALHYAVQLLRPRWGHGSDGTGRRTPWIMGGMAVLACGGIAAAGATALIPAHPVLGLVAAIAAFGAVGLGIGAAGTATLALAATRVAAERQPIAAPVLWITMIAGFAVTAGLAGAWLTPFTLSRLVAVTVIVCGAAFLLSCVAVWGLEANGAAVHVRESARPPVATFRASLRRLGAEPTVRRFALFVFLSMLATSAQDLVLEPFAGAVLGLPPGGTAALTGLQHGGALLGMIAVGLLSGTVGLRRPALLGTISAAGCLLSAAMLAGLAVASLAGTSGQVLRPMIVLLGFGNGAFAVAAVGAMMALAARGQGRHEGLRMGVWGAAQAAAFGLGSIIGPALIDLSRMVARPGEAYGAVFLAEAALFVLSAGLAHGALAAESDADTRLAMAEPA